MTQPSPSIEFHQTEPATSSSVKDVIVSEWTKFRTVRSTYMSLLISVAVMLALGSLITAAVVHRWNNMGFHERLTFDPTTRSLMGIFLAQLAIGVLGVLVISSEYATGTIRSTLAAVPQRLTVLFSKALVFAVTTFTVTLVGCFVSFSVGQAILSQIGIGTSLSQPGVLRAVIGGSLYLSVIGLLALGLGTIIRHTAGGITALVGLIMVLPGLVAALPSPWSTDIGKYLPGEAGMNIFSVVSTPNSLGPWSGFLVFCGWTAVILAIAGWCLVKRDA
ncbi:MAG TPA: ABC transporter permease [Acidimicrobiales bacterium]|nr:ABC transporter permease [Acidimicrobiales bacterium]